MTAYIGLIRKEQDSDFGVDFPDFPGCISAGQTLDEARRMAQEALQAHVHLMIEDGDVLPEPTTLDAVMADPDHQDAVAILVEVDIPHGFRRINITVNEDALVKIDRFAKAKGLTRSSFLSQAALREIERGKAA